MDAECLSQLEHLPGNTTWEGQDLSFSDMSFRGPQVLSMQTRLTIFGTTRCGRKCETPVNWPG